MTASFVVSGAYFPFSPVGAPVVIESAQAGAGGIEGVLYGYPLQLPPFLSATRLQRSKIQGFSLIHIRYARILCCGLKTPRFRLITGL